MIVRTCSVPYRCFSRYRPCSSDSLSKYQEFCCAWGGGVCVASRPKSELLSNAWKWIVCLRRTCAAKARGLIGRTPRWRAAGSESQENCSAAWFFAVSGFMVMGLIFELSGQPSRLTTCSSWWCTHCSAEMDSGEEDSGRLVGHGISFDFSQIILRVLVLTRTTCCKINYANSYNGAWPGWEVSVSVSSDKLILVIMIVTIFWVLTMCQAISTSFKILFPIHCNLVR